MARELALGIDFGSSSTIAGTYIGDRIELVQDQGEAVIPSLVYIPQHGPVEVGRAAATRQLSDPRRVVRSVKRVLGLPSQSDLVRRYAHSVPFRVETTLERPVFKLGAETIAPEQVVAHILARVRDLAQRRFGATISKVVMTMSAAAPAGYRDAAIRAARIAHLEVVGFIAEPIAGTLALDLHREHVDRRVVVCDLGGGTFDVSAVVQEGQRFTPVATYGDHFLGGDDFDYALAEAVAGAIVRKSGYDIHSDLVRWTELLLRCESVKRQLGSGRDVPLAMRDAYLQGGARRDLQTQVAPAWADGVWEPLMERVRGVIDELLQRAGWSTDHVDAVGLVGGGSLLPLFRRVVAERFGPDKLVMTEHAEIAVAQGAALLTARFNDPHAAVPSLVA